MHTWDVYRSTSEAPPIDPVSGTVGPSALGEVFRAPQGCARPWLVLTPKDGHAGGRLSPPGSYDDLHTSCTVRDGQWKHEKIEHL